MNKKSLLILLFFLILISLSIFAISIRISSDDNLDERFFGTWKAETGFITYTFYANGKIITQDDDGTLEGIWSIENGRIIFIFYDGHRRFNSPYVFINDATVTISGMPFYKVNN